MTPTVADALEGVALTLLLLGTVLLCCFGLLVVVAVLRITYNIARYGRPTALPIRLDQKDRHDDHHDSLDADG